MDENRKPGKLREIWAYLPEAFRFYNLKNEYVAAVIFTFLLIITYIPVFFSSAKIRPVFIYLAVAFILVLDYLFSAVYLTACIRDSRGLSYRLSDCLTTMFRNIHRLLAVSMLLMGLIACTALLVIPAIIFYLMFIFNACLIVDENAGILESFKKSKEMTDGRKGRIFNVILFFALLRILPFMIPVPENRIYAANFVIAFLSSMISLMQQKAIALMYVDLKKAPGNLPL